MPHAELLRARMRIAAQSAALDWFVDAMRVRIASRSLVQRSINVAGVEAGLAEALGKLEADLLSRHQGPGQEQRLALCRLEFAHLASDIVARVEQGLTLQELERLGPAGRFDEGVNGPS